MEVFKLWIGVGDTLYEKACVTKRTPAFPLSFTAVTAKGKEINFKVSLAILSGLGSSSHSCSVSDVSQSFFCNGANTPVCLFEKEHSREQGKHFPIRIDVFISIPFSTAWIALLLFNRLKLLSERRSLVFSHMDTFLQVLVLSIQPLTDQAYYFMLQ